MAKEVDYLVKREGLERSYEQLAKKVDFRIEKASLECSRRLQVLARKIEIVAKKTVFVPEILIDGPVRKAKLECPQRLLVRRVEIMARKAELVLEMLADYLAKKEDFLSDQHSMAP